MSIVTVQCTDCGFEFSCWTPDGRIPGTLRVCVSCTVRKAEEIARRRKRVKRQDSQSMQAMLKRLEQLNAEVGRLSKLLGERVA